jgi:hypothetical protein
MKNETVVKSVGTCPPGSKDIAGYFPVGTRVMSFFGETADTEDGADVFTGFSAEGRISGLLLGQEHCYAVDFPFGVSVFLSPAELANSSCYQVILRVIAHFQPQGWIRGHAIDLEGDCDIDVTERLLDMALADIHDLDDNNYQSDGLVYGMTSHVGPHYVTVKDSVLGYFGVARLSDITEAMLMEKRLQYAGNPSGPNGKLHNVHIYAVVRVEARNVEAENHPEAIKQAEEKVGLHHRLTRGNDQEYAEEINCFLVEEVGDSNCLNSRWYKPDGVTLLDKPHKAEIGLPCYKVTLFEHAEDIVSIVFECQAEDIRHAIEQAENAYPAATVIGAVLMKP